MLSADDKAVRRVLGAIEAMLSKPPAGDCAACGNSAARYAVDQAADERRARLARARAFAEIAVDSADRALEQIELAERC